WPRSLKRHLIKEDLQVTNSYMKRCSTLCGIWKRQVETMDYHRIPRTAQIQNPDNTQCWRGWGATGKTLLHCWWACKLVQPLWKTVCRFLKKLTIELPSDPEIAPLGIYPKNTKMLVRRNTFTLTFITALSTIAKLWKEPK
ncbi:LORF2 protein, partial [Crocuta crocuta]